MPPTTNRPPSPDMTRESEQPGPNFIEADVNGVIASLQGQIANQALEIAKRDAVLKVMQEQMDQLAAGAQ